MYALVVITACASASINTPMALVRIYNGGTFAWPTSLLGILNAWNIMLQIHYAPLVAPARRMCCATIQKKILSLLRRVCRRWWFATCPRSPLLRSAYVNILHRGLTTFTWVSTCRRRANIRTPLPPLRSRHALESHVRYNQICWVVEQVNSDGRGECVGERTWDHLGAVLV